MSVIEDFKLDMADEFDISYAKANNIFDLLIKMISEHLPGRISKQRMLDAAAKSIKSDRIEMVNNFKKVLDHEEEVKTELNEIEGRRAVAAVDRAWKRIDKTIHQLARGEV